LAFWILADQPLSNGKTVLAALLPPPAHVAFRATIPTNTVNLATKGRPRPMQRHAVAEVRPADVFFPAAGAVMGYSCHLVFSMSWRR
jgi:hypothetical protein